MQEGEFLDETMVARWARVLVHYSLALQAGQRLWLHGDAAADPLMRAVYREALSVGAFIDVQVIPAWYDLELLRQGSMEQLAQQASIASEGLQQADALLSIGAETNLRALGTIEPARQTRALQARRHAWEQARTAAAGRDYARCYTLWPTEAYAQEAGMALDDFTDLVRRACFLDDADPIERWRALGARQAALIRWLADKDQVQIKASGTDLRFSIVGRTLINSDGHRNFPSGEIFTGPIEESVEGEITFTGRSLRDGHLVRDVYLRFEGGRVVEAYAAQGQEYLDACLSMDEGARRVGEIAFGTNDAITMVIGNTLFDEKIGGTMHLALGASYPETGGRNVSALHWDLVCDLRQDGVVLVDETIFSRNGIFQV